MHKAKYFKWVIITCNNDVGGIKIYHITGHVFLQRITCTSWQNHWFFSYAIHCIYVRRILCIKIRIIHKIKYLFNYRCTVYTRRYLLSVHIKSLIHSTNLVNNNCFLLQFHLVFQSIIIWKLNYLTGTFEFINQRLFHNERISFGLDI